jgi:hypothetical protein
LADLDTPDFQTYPLLKRVTCHHVTAGAGDLLYMPPRWWHEVRTESFSVTLNASLFQTRGESAREIFSYFGNSALVVAAVGGLRGRRPLRVPQLASHTPVDAAYAGNSAQAGSES